MGDIADYYISRAIDADPPVHRRSKRITWTTADGRVLEPREMGSVHLINCLHLIERGEGHYMNKQALNNAPTYHRMVSVLVQRGELTWDYLRLPIELRLKVRI